VISQVRTIVNLGALRRILWLSFGSLILLEGHILWKAHSPQATATVPSILCDVTRVVPMPYPDLAPYKVPTDWMYWIANMGHSLLIPCTITKESIVRSKETLSGFLSRVGIKTSTVHNVVKAIGKQHISLKAGQKLSYVLEYAGSYTLKSLSIPINFGEEIHVNRMGDGSYRLKKVSLPVVKTVRCVRGILRTHFSADAGRSGIPKEIIKNVLDAFGTSINFKRNLHPGDQFEVLFNHLSVKGSKESKSGNLLYASIVVGGTKIAVYRFPSKKGDCFYTADGENVQHGMFSLPIKGARKTSGFGNRIHPILGYSRRHKGIDFSAPRGTPVSASADGIIEKVTTGRGYGRCIALKHANGYSTFYAHLNRFNKGICPGVRVKRGEVIGFVGASGLVTGSHLHYEVRLFGKPINPASVKSFAVQKLSGKELKRFKELKRTVDATVQRVVL
jgi:murein DD-endopeptidase MepM/ murein hydrolase activator NlpD